jgi:hypothetical protein
MGQIESLNHLGGIKTRRNRDITLLVRAQQGNHGGPKGG